ncbi:MAG: bacteriophage abortive infection AbiH family protein [Alistipes senegalensis]|nr:bacteriophage abortive infection AbiH family protein [Bacteroides cellulosilyticus]MCM1352953.1 bacteriophage abortive infection AbiH family protein [Alistipes senegalensis]
MNRIVLIGNGFDLAHGLHTSYADFIKGYHNMRSYLLIHENGMETNDGLCTYEAPDSESRKYLNQVRPLITDNRFSYITQNCIEDIRQRFKKKYSSKFFEEVNKAVETYNWVDIEAVYYRWLTRIFKQGGAEYVGPNKLNDELKTLEDNLVIYLAFIQAKFIKPELKVEDIRKAIYEPFNARDISIKSQEEFIKFVETKWNDVKSGNHSNRMLSARNYGNQFEDVRIYEDSYLKQNDLTSHQNNIKEKYPYIPSYFLLPDQILFLNFNYTHTAELYIPKDSEFKVNHIHGELSNEKNPIIFGYGDELDDDYKEIAKLNDNDYMKNIKSIRYLETDNYRKLLSFIDSAPFQIYIMGHSCGNSDRTLLNTLFEHKNCVSIKPFYHKRPDGTDNYIEIVQNISRNFNDMRLMRDRVVNKTYCRPMVEVTTE